jgi:hypothetical protein
MIPLIATTLGFVQYLILLDSESQGRPTLFIEDRALVGVVRTLVGGWLEVVDCSSNPRMHAQQICAQDADSDRRNIVWIYEDGQDEANPNLWRERLAGQGFQVRSVTTIRTRQGKIDCLKTIPHACKQLSELHPELSWFFQSRRHLAEQHLSRHPSELHEISQSHPSILAN